MTINEYQTAALRTAQTDKFSASDLLLNSALGLCGESGEVADLVKKHLFQGHDLDLNHVAKELGDISWYLASAHTLSDLTLRAYSALTRKSSKHDTLTASALTAACTELKTMYEEE